MPIHFTSYKSKRVVRSAIAGEVIAFSDLFDVVITLSAEMALIIGRKVPVQLLTNSKSLFDVISKGTRTRRRRLCWASLPLARDIDFVRSSQNLANTNQADGSGCTTGSCIYRSTNPAPEQWIIRK